MAKVMEANTELKRKLGNLENEVATLKRKNQHGGGGGRGGAGSLGEAPLSFRVTQGKRGEEAQLGTCKGAEKAGQVSTDKVERETLRGLTTGRVVTVTPEMTCKFVCVGAFFPNWLLIMKELHFVVARVYLTDATFLPLVAEMCSSDTFITYDGPPTLGACSKVDVMFVDKNAGPNLFKVATLANISQIYSLFGRRQPEGWSHRFLSVQHNQVGGVTSITTRVHLFWWTQSHAPSEATSISHFPRDCSTLLDATARTFRYRPKASSRHVDPIGCEMVGRDSKGNPIYHGGGLLPSELQRKTLITTLTIYRKGCWAVRTLTGVEYGLVYDLPEPLAKKHSENVEFLALLRPLKSLLYGF